MEVNVCSCKIPDITSMGECVKCHLPRVLKVFHIEMSTDGGENWERLSRVPFNSKPFHQTQHFGEYREGNTLYRRVMEEQNATAI